MILSFGYGDKKGLPRADKVFDVRDLSHDTNSPAFDAHTQEILDYAKKHPTQLIAVGCEKGAHRSRTIVDRVATKLRTSKFHRDWKGFKK